MGADLHLHTTASDGSISPKQLVEIAAEIGLEAIAITDHDTFDGIDEAIEAAKDLPIEIIPGIEFAADAGGKDIHIISYWPDYRLVWLQNELVLLRQARVNRTRLIIEELNENNVDISLKEVLAVAQNASVGRMHVAKILIAKGYASSIKDAFDRYIGPGGCCYVKKPSRSPERVIDLIKEAGGVAVVAHPGLADCDDVFPFLIEHGLDGIEAYHPDHSVQQIKYYEDLAHHYNLIVTAGSDFHAKNGKGAMPGTYQVPMSTVEALKHRC